MSYNESLSSNSNYPAMSQSQWDSAPFNEVEVPEKEFEVTCSQSLSRTAIVTTNNYIPGASGVDYERDDGGGYTAIGYQDPDDTSDTCWKDEYKNNGYTTPLELIGILKTYLGKELTELENSMEPNDRSYKATQARRLRFLIGECESWTEDEIDFEKD